jgi:hypothetical protein
MWEIWTLRISVRQRRLVVKTKGKAQVSSAALHPSVRENHSIPSVSKVKKMDKVDGHDADKSELIKLDFLMDPEKPALDSK